jgi:hypothetical protein
VLANEPVVGVGLEGVVHKLAAAQGLADELVPVLAAAYKPRDLQGLPATLNECG